MNKVPPSKPATRSAFALQGPTTDLVEQGGPLLEDVVQRLALLQVEGGLIPAPSVEQHGGLVRAEGPPACVAAPGTAAITVFTPLPGGGETEAASLLVEAPPPRTTTKTRPPATSG